VQNQELDPSVEIAHLRRLLDIQPTCLMRLGADGTVLAANDAALTLMGVASGAQALERDFAAWVPADQRGRWRAFTLGVAQGSPASIECDITTPSGDRHPTLFHAVPVADHPDGVASVAVAARAVASQRQLEAAIVDLEEQLREREAERLKAKALLAEAIAEADATRRAAEAKVARALADVRQLEIALESFAARQKQVTAERDRLASALREHAGHLEELAKARPSAGAGTEEGQA